MSKKDKKKQVNKESIFNYDDEVEDYTSNNLKRIQKEKRKKKKLIIKEQKRQKREQARKNVKFTQQEIRMVKKAQNILKGVCVLIVVVTIIILILLSPIFNIKKIEVKGNTSISEQEIISLLQIELNTNLFKERSSTIVERLKQNSYIGQVNIDRVIPSTLIITIKERTIKYLFELGDSYVYVDEQGYILEISKNNIEDKIKVKGYSTPEEELISGKRLCENDLDMLNVIGQIIKAAENNDIAYLITEIDISNSEDILLYLDSEQKIVHLGNKENLDIKMPYIKEIINKNKDIKGEIFVNVDLNTKWPYFRF